MISSQFPFLASTCASPHPLQEGGPVSHVGLKQKAPVAHLPEVQSEESESDSDSGKGKKGAALANGGPKETFGSVVFLCVMCGYMCSHHLHPSIPLHHSSILGVQQLEEVWWLTTVKIFQSKRFDQQVGDRVGCQRTWWTKLRIQTCRKARFLIPTFYA